MLVDELTVSGLLRVLRQMQANELTVDQINEISGEDLSTLVSNLADIQEKITAIQTTIEECETSASIFKTGIADAIKDVDSTATVTGDSSLPDFTSGIQNIVPNVTSDATATAELMAEGYTAYVNGNKVTGTMRKWGDAWQYADDGTVYDGRWTNGTIYRDLKDVWGNPYVFIEATAGSQHYISKGKYIRLGVKRSVMASALGITADKVLSGNTLCGVVGTATSDANAEASHILSGKTAYVNGSKVSGVIPDRRKLGISGMVGLNSGGWANVAVSITQCWHDQTNSDGIRRLCLQAPGGLYGGSDSNINSEGDGYVGIDLACLGGATASQVLSGATFTSTAGLNVTGSILNRTSNTGTSNLSWAGTNLSAGDGTFYAGNSSDQLIVPIPNGYYNGNYNSWGCCGLVVNNISSRLGITDKARTILSGNKILGVSGTLPNYSGVVTHINYSRIANGRVEFACEEGYHGCYWAGNSYEYMTYDEVLNLIGCSSDKIVSGKSVLNRAGTGVNGYQCRTWSYTAAVGEGSSGAFTLLGGTKTLSSSSWVNSASSSNSSYYSGQIDDLSGKINSSTFAICRVTAPDHGIRRGNGYGSGSTTASYRYLKELVLFADDYLSQAGMDGVDWAGTHEAHVAAGSTYIKRIRGYWLDSNRDNSSTATSSHQLVEFHITEKGYVCVEFIADTTNVFAFRGPLKFEFWVFYK